MRFGILQVSGRICKFPRLPLSPPVDCSLLARDRREAELGNDNKGEAALRGTHSQAALGNDRGTALGNDRTTLRPLLHCNNFRCSFVV